MLFMKYIKAIFCVLITCTLMTSCKTKEKIITADNPPFDTQAHRGGRGLMPENTIPAMLDAIDRNVNTLELDLQISKDRKVLVSHDPYFNEKITTTPEGRFLTKEEARKRLLYGMTYDSIAKYDIGLKPNPDFTRKKNIVACKPLLAELIQATEKYARKKSQIIHYNMEIKSTVKGENVNHPPVKEYVDLVMSIVAENGIMNRTTIQSFDVRALRILNRKYPLVDTSYLVNYKEKRSAEELLDRLGFVPSIYSPDYRHVTSELITYCHAKKIKVIPWTVNDIETLQRMIDLKVDGVISDYPNLYEELKLITK